MVLVLESPCVPFLTCINGYRRQLLRVTLRWTSAPGPGGVAILLGMLHAKETGVSSGRLGPWLVCASTLPLRERNLSLW